MKTEVYSWRVSIDLKSGLEREARRRKISRSGLLDLAAREWLTKGCPDNEDEDQMRLQAAALTCFGAIDGSDPDRSQNARQEVRRRRRRQNGR